jgi:hypothetical protein
LITAIINQTFGLATTLRNLGNAISYIKFASCSTFTSFIYSFVFSFIYSFIPAHQSPKASCSTSTSFIHLFIHSFIFYTFIHSIIDSFNHSFHSQPACCPPKVSCSTSPTAKATTNSTSAREAPGKYTDTKPETTTGEFHDQAVNVRK